MVGCMVKKLEPSITLINHVRLLKSSYISPLYPFFAKQLKKYADQIICVSEAVKKDINNGANVQVIYDCPDVTEKYPPWDGLHNPNTLKILYLGNYIPGKGHDLGLQAFTIFHQFFPKATLTFAGASNTDTSRQFKEMLISKAAEARIDQCVIFEDSVSDVEYEMKAYDIVLNLSESESFSFVCLEAMLYGVPLVAANSGGPAEITDYGKKAILVENKNPVAASEGLKKIANATVVYREMAANAQRWAAKRFDAFKETEKLTLIYKTIT